MNMREGLLLAILVLTVSKLALSQELPAISLIPQPVALQSGEGSFEVNSTTAIEIKNPELNSLAEYLSARFGRPSGITLPVKTVSEFSPGNIHLDLQPNTTDHSAGYELVVSSGNVQLRADSAAGIFYGIQTLMQLLPRESYSNKEVANVQWILPVVKISDYPRFRWRGLMLDVARHFFTKQEVKDFIDRMVQYKFNVLHLHLSDDQGWRIEIKSLPKLTEVGAWRPERKGRWANTSKPEPSEPKNYGGFYTQDDIRELVAYAKERFVDIMPEIDVPGHSLAAVAAYPELSCTPGNYYVSVGDKIMQWHSKGFSALIDNTLCPANEKVYEFLDKVFGELAALFPFPYIHMGGDECAKDFWLKSAAVKQLMVKEGLKDMHEVQSYFVKRVEKIINSKGKRLIGWDEILEGGLPPNATVMSWRGMKGGVAAAKQGHQVVMSPATHVYLDLAQGDTLFEPPVYSTVLFRDTYKFDPLPAGVDEKLILGGQGNLWTEQIQNVRHMQYMMYPRVLAVAESVWSPPSHKDWKNFIKRVEEEFTKLDMASIKYSRAMYDPILKVSSESGLLKLQLDTQIEGLTIHYSFDGSFPDNFYPAYSKPLLIPRDASVLKLVTYRDGVQVGKQIAIPVALLWKRIRK